MVNSAWNEGWVWLGRWVMVYERVEKMMMWWRRMCEERGHVTLFYPCMSIVSTM